MSNIEEIGRGELLYEVTAHIPSGKYRNELCVDCCICPAVILSWCCPFIVWGQIAKHIYGSSNLENGMKYFYAIVFGFTFLIFVVACLGKNGDYLAYFLLFPIFITMSTLQRHMRKIYGIKSKVRCGTEACDECCQAFFCVPCTTFQMGNHLFDYKKNPEIICDPFPHHFFV